jgi:hypothetical protein
VCSSDLDVSSSFWQLHSPGIISFILNYTDRGTEVLLSYTTTVVFCWSNYYILCSNNITNNEDTKKEFNNKHSTDNITCDDETAYDNLLVY